MHDASIDEIHRYLLGEMSGNELADFEKRKQTDTALAANIALESRLLDGLSAAGAGQPLRAQLRAVREKLQAEGFFNTEADKPVELTINAKRQYFLKNALAIAATVVLLLGALWFLNVRKPASDPKALYAKYFSPEKDKAASAAEGLVSYGMAGVKTPQDTLRMGLQHYEAGKYNEAQPLLDSALVKLPENDTAHYFLALTKMSLERYARAIELLKPLTLKKGSPYHYDAAWSLGLCYLMADGGAKDALAIFESLSKDANFKKRREAGEIRSMLGGKRRGIGDGGF